MTRRHICVPVAYFLLNFSILAAQNWMEMSDPVRPYVTRLTDGNGLSCGLATQEEMVSIREAIDRMPPRTPPSGKYALAPPAANISVNYNGFTPEVRAAFQRAVDIWSSLLITTVPIEIEANFTTFEEEEKYFLGLAGPSTFFFNKITELFYPVALFSQFVGRDYDPGEPDLEVSMSDSSNWYYGLDGNPGENQFDFVSVVLHEIGHGLGFSDSFRVDESTEEAEYGINDDNIPTAFDAFILVLDTENEWRRLIDEDEYTNPSIELAEAITGIKLFWYGTKTGEANGGHRPVLLWAPGEYGRSSVAHLDYDAYPPGTSNELMNPFRPKGQAAHEPGPIVLAMLGDMGWTIREQTLQIPHFGVGSGLSSDVVVINRSSTETRKVKIFGRAADP